METETKAPSAVESEGVTGGVLGQTLIKSSSIRRWGPASAKQKTLEPKGARVEMFFEQTDSPLALFFVVAISRVQHTLNHSTSSSAYHRSLRGGKNFNLGTARRFLYTPFDEIPDALAGDGVRHRLRGPLPGGSRSEERRVVK